MRESNGLYPCRYSNQNSIKNAVYQTIICHTLAKYDAKIAQISEIPSNSLIFLPCGQYHDGVLLGLLVAEEADGRVAGLLLIIS